MSQKFLLRVFIGAMFCLLSALCAAQQPRPLDGNWIKKGVDAFNRVYVTRNAGDTDMSDGLVLVSYVSGMIAVHRQNNLLAAIIVGSANQKSAKLP